MPKTESSGSSREGFRRARARRAGLSLPVHLLPGLRRRAAGDRQGRRSWRGRTTSTQDDVARSATDDDGVDTPRRELLPSPDPCCQCDSQRARRAGCLPRSSLSRWCSPRRACPPRRRRQSRRHRAKSRALWVLRTSLRPAKHRVAGAIGPRPRLQHAAGAGARPRRRLFQRRPRTARRRAARQPAGFDPLATRAHRGARRRAPRPRVGQRQPRVERRRPAGRPRASHLSPPRLADGAARDRAGRRQAAGPTAPPTSASSRDGRAAQTGELEGLYASPIVPDAAAYYRARRRATWRRRYPTRRRAPRLRALSQHAVRLQPLRDRRVPRRRCGRGCRRSAAAQLDARRGASISSPIPTRCPDDWKAFRVAPHDGADARGCAARQSGAAGRARHRRRQPGSARSLRRPPAGLAHLAPATASSTSCARWPTRRNRRGSRSRSPPRATSPAAGPIWAGIGAYRLSPAQTVDNIQAARRLGAAGVVLFSYDSLTDPRSVAPDYLAPGRAGGVRAAGVESGLAGSTDPHAAAPSDQGAEMSSPFAEVANLLERAVASTLSRRRRSRSAPARASSGARRSARSPTTPAADPRDSRHDLRSRVADQGHRDDHARHARASTRDALALDDPVARWICRPGAAPIATHVTIARSPGARLRPDRLPALLPRSHRARRVRARDLRAAARVRAPHAVDLQRPRASCCSGSSSRTRSRSAPASRVRPAPSDPSRRSRRNSAAWRLLHRRAARLQAAASWRDRTAPTELDPWRGRLLVGEVHDENTLGARRRRGPCRTVRHGGAVGAFARAVLGRSPATTVLGAPDDVAGSCRRADGARQLARARLGHDAPDLVVRDAAVARVDRAYRLHRHVALDRPGARSLRRAARPTACTRRGTTSRSSACGRRSTMRSWMPSIEISAEPIGWQSEQSACGRSGGSSSNEA